MNNKNFQLLIKQLKDKMHDLKEVLEAKKKDMEGQDIEIAEMKTKLGELIIECETLYNEYDEKRIQVNLSLYIWLPQLLQTISFNYNSGARIKTQS